MSWVIGDIHGEKELLLKLLNTIGTDEDLYCVGDVIDRGPDALGCIDICIDKNIKVVLGNHEDMAVDCLLKGEKYQEGIWTWNGGDKTLLQLEFLTQADLKEKFKRYLDWMIGLKPYYIIDDKFLVSHAGVHNDIEADVKSGEILWRRVNPKFPEKKLRIEHPKYFQIVGHTPQKGEPLITEQYANIDTGVFFSGKLTAIHLPSKEIVTVSQVKITDKRRFKEENEQ